MSKTLISIDIWMVRSSSNPDIRYMQKINIDEDDHRWISCNCPAWTRGKEQRGKQAWERTCKHVGSARVFQPTPDLMNDFLGKRGNTAKIIYVGKPGEAFWITVIRVKGQVIVRQTLSRIMPTAEEAEGVPKSDSNPGKKSKTDKKDKDSIRDRFAGLEI